MNFLKYIKAHDYLLVLILYVTMLSIGLCENAKCYLQ